MGGSKNVFNHVAAVAALGDGVELVLRNAPANSDRDLVLHLLENSGFTVDSDGCDVVVSGSPRGDRTPDIGSRMRVGLCFAAALASSTGHARCPRSSGCAFANRPIDVHVRVLRAAGAQVHERSNSLDISFPAGPRSFNCSLLTESNRTSVGGTVTALLVAARANGVSTLIDTSREPEVVATLSALRQLDVRTYLDGRGTIVVEGRGAPLTGTATIAVPPDQIEAGTYLLAGLLLRSEAQLRGIEPSDFSDGARDAFIRAGVELTSPEGPGASIRARCCRGIQSTHVSTAPHPGFPTDMQPPFVAFLTQAMKGQSSVRERVYDARVSHVPQLARLGLKIELLDDQQYIAGGQEVIGQLSTVTDIRCGAALIVAAAASEKPVLIDDPGAHLARGYGQLDWKLHELGFDVARLSRS